MPDAPANEFRFELKFVLAHEQLATAVSWLRCHSACFRSQWPERRVNSLYLDSPDRLSLAESLAGLSERRKLRLRWYGPLTGDVDGSLELKQRRGAVGRKMSAPVPGPLSIGAWTRARMMAELRARAAGFLPLFDCLEPTCLISYRRRYLRSADSRVRVTIDSGMTGYDQSRSVRMNTRYPNLSPAAHVIELKAEWRHEDAAKAIADDFPVRRSSWSKYVSEIIRSQEKR